MTRDLLPHELEERQKQLRASRGPGYTFWCTSCGVLKLINGRRKINGAWCCPICAKEKENEPA